MALGTAGNPLISQIQATAAAPASVELSDGAAFYTGAKTGQLPAALVSNRLDVNLGKTPGTVSTANSSTATLLGNAVFTGTSEDVSGYSLIEVTVFADQVSAAGGLSLQFSSNGTNWDFTQAVTVSASAGAAYAVCPAAQFFRLVYTNGAVNQTAFRLQTVYRPAGSLPTLAAFQDVNAAITPPVIVQRVAADMMIQDAADNLTERVRCAKDLITGVGGATLLGQAAGIYQTADTKFYPWVGTQTGGGFMQGAAAAGATVVGNPVLGGGSDGANARALLTDTSGRQIIVGAAAAGAGVAGNPVLQGISDGTNAQNVRQIQSVTPNSTIGVSGYSAAAVALHQASGDMRMWASVNASADNSAGGSIGTAGMMAQNSLTANGFDRLRNNVATVVQASTLTTAQTINTDITNYNGRAFMAHANVTIYNGGSITMTLQWKDANGLFVTIPGATTGAVTSGADVMLNVGPTVWPANTATVFNVNWFLPRLLRLVTVIGTASVTFSQSFDLAAN